MKIPKLKNKAFQIDLGIYPFAVFVCFGDVEKLRPVLQAYKYTIDAEAIDNLIKGAGGQAVQSMNIMFGLDEFEGLEFLSMYL